MNGLFDNRNMAIVYHECIWAFSIFSLFLLVSFRVLFHERNQVGDKNPDLFSCRTTGRRVAVNGGGHKSDGTIVCPLFEVSCRSGSFAGGRSGWRCFMPAINIRICLLSLLPLQPPRMAGRSRAFLLAVHAARFCWRRNNAMASR